MPGDLASHELDLLSPHFTRRKLKPLDEACSESRTQIPSGAWEKLCAASLGPCLAVSAPCAWHDAAFLRPLPASPADPGAGTWPPSAGLSRQAPHTPPSCLEQAQQARSKHLIHKEAEGTSWHQLSYRDRGTDTTRVLGQPLGAALISPGH